MKRKRKLLINDRVKGLVLLCAVMAVSLLIVFIGIEVLKYLPSLSPQQKDMLEGLTYPRVFKLFLVVLWGVFAALSAYCLLFFKYSGFVNRLNDYFEKLSEGKLETKFYFRNNDRPAIIQDSLEVLIHKYQSNYQELTEQIKSLKNKLSG